MIPLPGFQKPAPYFAPEQSAFFFKFQKQYQSEFRTRPVTSTKSDLLYLNIENFRRENFRQNSNLDENFLPTKIFATKFFFQYIHLNSLLQAAYILLKHAYCPGYILFKLA